MKPKSVPIEVITGDEVRAKSLESKKDFKSEERRKEIEDNKYYWANQTTKSLDIHLRRANIIVDPWATLEEYSDLTLPNGWYVTSTSKHPNKPGTLLLANNDKDIKDRIKSVYKRYLLSQGLTLAQADTFIATLYYAKFTTLPFLAEALADPIVYRGLRSYNVGFKREEFFKWLEQYGLRDNELYKKLLASDRVALGEMLNRMAGADKKLVAYREEMRTKHGITKA